MLGGLHETYAEFLGREECLTYTIYNTCDGLSSGSEISEVAEEIYERCDAFAVVKLMFFREFTDKNWTNLDFPILFDYVFLGFRDGVDLDLFSEFLEEKYSTLDFQVIYK